MDIDRMLREDATSLAQVQPPTDLRARLQACLAAVPPHNTPAKAIRPVGKWFAPAAAVLVMAMVVILLLPPSFYTPATKEGFILHQSDPQPDGLLAETTEQHRPPGSDIIPADNKVQQGRPSQDLSDPQKQLPLGRIGIFAGLALITGLFCVMELRRRPRLLVPALVVLFLFLALGLAHFLGLF